MAVDQATLILVTPMWQAQSWYPQLLQMAVKNLSSSTKVAQSIDRYKSGKSCISRKRKLAAPAMDSFREKLSLEGVPRFWYAFQISWTHIQSYAFPTLFLIGRVLKKVALDQAILILVTPMWQAQSWYAQLLQMAVKNLLLPKSPNLLIGTNLENHVLVEKDSFCHGQFPGKFIFRRTIKGIRLPYDYHKYQKKGRNPSAGVARETDIKLSFEKYI